METTTASGVASRISKDRKGVLLLPEGGGEAYWVNFGDYSPECPEELAQGMDIQVTYTKYGRRFLVDSIQIGGVPREGAEQAAQSVHSDPGEVPPIPEAVLESPPEPAQIPSLEPVRVATPVVAPVSQPPIVIQQAPAGPDRSALRLYARIHAMELALKVLRYNFSAGISDEEILAKSKIYEEHFLKVIEDPDAPTTYVPGKDEDQDLPDEDGASVGDSGIDEFLSQSHDFMRVLKEGGSNAS